VGVVWALAACTDAGQEELGQWMRDERNAVKPKVEPVPEPKKFIPQAYTGEGAISPFSSEKLVTALQADKGTVVNAALIAPELKRRKEPLELLPLDTVKMVGVLDKNGQKVALVRAESLLYQVRAGQYIGQNYGRIVRITEVEVILREIVQDPSGEWVERQAALQLQEGIK
jgi:type IV pilus assembly protein PilP